MEAETKDKNKGFVRGLDVPWNLDHVGFKKTEERDSIPSMEP